MIKPAVWPSAMQPLRVSVHVSDAALRARLRALLRDHAHDVVDTDDECDVVVSDGDGSSLAGSRVVTLGPAGSDCAGGVLPYDATPAQIDAAIRAVAQGLLVRAPAIEPHRFGAMKEASLAVLLTPREFEVLDAIVEGLPNKLIAQRLDISIHTVKFHVEAVFRKLGVRTRTEAAAKAWQYRNEALEL